MDIFHRFLSLLHTNGTLLTLWGNACVQFGPFGLSSNHLNHADTCTHVSQSEDKLVSPKYKITSDNCN